jgi:ADP-heptose:LPS heptosyltransferase
LRSAKRNNLRLRLLRLAAAGLATRAPRSAAQPERVLLLRPDHIGDVLLTAPAVALLRESLPAAYLTYIVGPWSLEAARHGPPVDSLRTLRFPGFTRGHNANLVAPYALLLREAARLRREGYALALVLRPDHWWGALLALVAGIPVRVGADHALTRPLLTHARIAPPGQHAADQALDLARLALRTSSVAAAEPIRPPALASDPSPGQPVAQPRDRGVPTPSPRPGTASMFSVAEADRERADRAWHQSGLAGAARVVGLHPNAGAKLKSWPVERWAALADALLANGLAVMLFGAPDDGPMLRAIQAAMSFGSADSAPGPAQATRDRAPIACGQALGVSAALYARCAVVVALDSGAAHLAAAVGTPTVRLYGPAPTDLFGPWPARADQRVLVSGALACVPCGHLEAPPCGAITRPACLLALGVADVLKAVERQLARA